MDLLASGKGAWIFSVSLGQHALTVSEVSDKKQALLNACVLAGPGWAVFLFTVSSGHIGL
jgi:hypothetical protein